MNNDFDFTLEDSEAFIQNFHTVTDGPMSDVARALRSLAFTPPLPAKTKPKLLPSQVSISQRRKFGLFSGGLVTGVATIGGAVGLALGAAAFTGNVPPIISEVVKKTASVISHVIINPFSNNNQNAPTTNTESSTVNVGNSPEEISPTQQSKAELEKSALPRASATPEPSERGNIRREAQASTIVLPPALSNEPESESNTESKADSKTESHTGKDKSKPSEVASHEAEPVSETKSESKPIQSEATNKPEVPSKISNKEPVKPAESSQEAKNAEKPEEDK